jgi:RNA polymerase sigma factor (sigma-70 family)
MTAETSSAMAQPDPARSPAAVAHPARQHQRSEHTSRVPRARARTGTGPVRDDLAVVHLVTRASDGDKQAWDALIERYAPLIWSICRQYRLGDADADDAAQRVWLQLVNHLDGLRDPTALPGWLSTTAHRECSRVRRTAARPDTTGYVVDADTLPDERTTAADQELLKAERHAALREAFAALPLSGQRLLAMLTADPPVPYAEISAMLGIPVGSIGPTRRRYLGKLRRHPAIAALIDPDSDIA